MKIAVTGCSGYIGKKLIKELSIDKKNEIIGLSSSIKSKKYKFWNTSFQPKYTAKLIKKTDIVIHLAAYIPLEKNNYSEAKKCLEINSLGTLNLLRACILAKVKRFIYISTFNIFSYENKKKQNTKIVDCQNAPYYLGSKLLGEIYVNSVNFSKLSTLIIRPSSIYGPGMKYGIFNTFINKLVKQKKIKLQNKGNFKSDFLYLDDCVSAIKFLSLSKFSGAVDIGSGKTTSISTIINYMSKILSVKKNITYLNGSSNFKGYDAVNLNKIKSLMNFQPRSIKNGIKDIIFKTVYK